jgi:hypothetical protein
MEQLVFANNGIISLIDILTIGGSEKRSDTTKIGQYSSGLSYAVSIFIRHGIGFYIVSGDFQYTFQAEEMIDAHTGKTKEVVGVNMKNLTTGTEEHYQTAFSTEFGYDWTLAMGIREVYSNCLDEDGKVFTNDGVPAGFDTVFVIDICDQIEEIVDSWNLYFLSRDEEPLFENRINGVKIYFNDLPGQPYTIYKNGIQVYTDPTIKSLLVYDHRSADLDERRVIRELSNTEWRLSDSIKSMNECDIIHTIFSELSANEKLYENDLINSGNFSKEWIETINGLYNEYGDDFPRPGNTSFWNCILKDHKFNLNAKKISSTDNWWSSESVLVSTPTEEEKLEITINSEPVPFDEYIKNEIENNYDFEVGFPIVESIISESTMKAVAYKNEGVLYVATDFDLHRDMPDFIKEHYRLSGGDIYQDFCDKLSK